MPPTNGGCTYWGGRLVARAGAAARAKEELELSAPGLRPLADAEYAPAFVQARKRLSEMQEMS